MTTLSITLRRQQENRVHTTRLHRPAVMHLDIIDELVQRAERWQVRPSLIEQVIETGYIRADN